jgi:hypothetical protein
MLVAVRAIGQAEPLENVAVAVGVGDGVDVVVHVAVKVRAFNLAPNINKAMSQSFTLRFST